LTRNNKTILLITLFLTVQSFIQVQAVPVLQIEFYFNSFPMYADLTISENNSMTGSEFKIETAPLALHSFIVAFLNLYWYLPAGFLIFLTAGFFAIKARLRNIKRREREKSLLRQQLLQSEMKALRSQMNPHFIFNAINSIQHYVLTNEKELANKYLVKFSKLMRNILDLSKEELITMKDELETVRLYLEIESLRFNDAFVFSIDCDTNINTEQLRLPPLLIQPFVENAIWHGLLLKEGKKELKISISKEAGCTLIKIDDNGIGRESAEKFRNREFSRKSLGMEITKSRLAVVNKTNNIFISYQVTDKRDNDGLPGGTTITIKMIQQ
jgi:LytS/YehU family sensor histidine kinase